MCRLSLRLPALILAFCLLFPSASFAESAEPQRGYVHAEFTLGFALHAGRLPRTDEPAPEGLGDIFKQASIFSGTLERKGISWNHEIRMYLDAAVRILGEEIDPLFL